MNPYQSPNQVNDEKAMPAERWICCHLNGLFYTSCYIFVFVLSLTLKLMPFSYYLIENILLLTVNIVSPIFIVLSIMFWIIDWQRIKNEWKNQMNNTDDIVVRAIASFDQVDSRVRDMWLSLTEKERMDLHDEIINESKDKIPSLKEVLKSWAVLAMFNRDFEDYLGKENVSD